MKKTLLFIALTGFTLLSYADGKYQFAPTTEDSAKMPHPLFGLAPDVHRNEAFAKQSKAGMEVFMRMTGANKGDHGSTGIVFMISNLDTSNNLDARVTLDLIDGSGQVLPVLDYPKLLDEVKNHRSESGGGFFFAFGSRKFVGEALGAYAIGSIISSAARSSRNDKESKITQVVEGHWLRPEYRIPPEARIDGVALLNGLPTLPLTARLTVNGQVFTFKSTSDMKLAEEARRSED